MEALGVAANAIAVVSVAFQLTEACVKLYKFWESIEDAPHEIATIKEDLQYLISIFRRIENNNHPVGECIAEGIQHCRIKVLELNIIIQSLDSGFKSSSLRKKRWTAFKAAAQSKHIQRFRESLRETKSTLTLALVHQCVMQSQQLTYTTSKEMNALEIPPYESTIGEVNTGTLMGQSSTGDYAVSHRLIAPPMYRQQHRLQHVPVLSNGIAKDILTKFEKLVPEQAMTSLKIEELMLHAIGQTAIATFESDSLEIFAQDGYTMDDSGTVRSGTFVYSENLRYRVRHHASSFQTALGCVWIRTTTIYLPGEADGEQGKTQCVTSFVFYPTKWVQQLGIRNGFEAVMASASRTWVFNCRLTVTRAVPEDSLIFELCRTGQTRAVETLFKKGLGSVVDTSPKGWKPLHFAAAAGHVDLCTMLIEAGADKSALAYEGPTASILSPISLFVAYSSELHADVKISMLRLFADCIDLADAESDGWTIHEWLKRSYARERVPISQNSITWLLLTSANEAYIQLSARSVWTGLQHAIRTVLCHEQQSRFLNRILNISDDKCKATIQSHLDAFGLLMAFRVSGRVLLQMAIAAGSFLQVRGFDWVEDSLSRREYLQALPNIYRAWCHALLDCVENMEEYMRLETEQYLTELGWTRHGLLDAISNQKTDDGSGQNQRKEHACTQCSDNYEALPSGLVTPVRISISECAQTSHQFDCVCHEFCEPIITRMKPELPDYVGSCFSDSDMDESDLDEEFYDAESYPLTDFMLAGQDTSATFSEVATLLYRSHGRAWMGAYDFEEHLCASCFLLRERYTAEDGGIADFPPVPKHFDGLRFKW